MYLLNMCVLYSVITVLRPCRDINGSFKAFCIAFDSFIRYNVRFLIGDDSNILVNVLLDGGGLSDLKII